MNARKAVLAALACTAMLVAAACSDETAGSAERDGADNGQQSEDLPHSGAPAVGDPIEDLSTFEDDMCRVLRDDQLEQLPVHVSEAEPGYLDTVGPKCSWRTESRSESFGAYLVTGNPEGLSHVYAQDAEGLFEYFEELDPVVGHPAVAANYNDDRKDGYCTVDVGLRDELHFYVAMSAVDDSSPYHDDPCGAAYEIAELVVETMKGDG
ncbi:DUF3558 domain-containing protein [Haloechinothrix sp. LS1_15]|uniref:DUF3558 domain-containing protein n=1 Tax=Haloechinothrix sp. LS1_15 TaxID=2652248 RepID=UPI0029478B9B|nr:DUF3558 domain-containing protein [Haloechinothrix sp. LS1_15]MDV6013722.1 DUF3558 domain-containing protein [Haloechinothrix sp. LS1_15]